MKRGHVVALMLIALLGSYTLGYANGRDHAYLQMIAANETCGTDLECEEEARTTCENIYDRKGFGHGMTDTERKQAIEECMADQKEGK